MFGTGMEPKMSFEEKMTATIIIVLIITSVVSVLYMSNQRNKQDQKIENMQLDLDYWHQNNLTKNISNSRGTFLFRSFDKGKTWYNEIRHSDGTVTMDPPDMEALRECLAFEEIVRRVKNKNLLDVTNDKDVQLLNDIGITVHKK